MWLGECGSLVLVSCILNVWIVLLVVFGWLVVHCILLFPVILFWFKVFVCGFILGFMLFLLSTSVFFP